MADIFISYQRQDKKNAQILANRITAAGLSVWWDHDLLGGQDYDVVIERELSASKVVIVIWSGLSKQSKWVKEEATRALKRDALIPVTFDYTEPPLGFGLSHVIQFSNSNSVTSEEFAKLYQSIQNKMGLEAAEPAPQKKKIKQNGDVKKYILYISCALLVAFGVWGIFNSRSRNADGPKQQPPKELIVQKWKFDRIMGPDAAKIPDEVKKEMLATATMEYKKDGSFEMAGGGNGANRKGTYTLSDDGKTLIIKNEGSNDSDTALVLILSKMRMVISPKLVGLNYQFSLVPDNKK